MSVSKNYNIYITSASVSGKAIDRSSVGFIDLQKKILRYIKSQEFKQYLKENNIHESCFKLKFRILSDKIQIIPLAKKIETLSTKVLSSKEPEKKTTTHSLAPKKTVSDPKPSSVIRGVHGLHNPRNGCYANAAFQLLHHTSLKESVIDQLPDKELQVKQLKVYDAVTGAGDVLAGVNTFRNKKTQLSTDRGEDASDVIHTLMDAAGYPAPSLITSKKISMNSRSEKILATSSELQRVVAKDQKEEAYSKGPILLLEPSQTATLEKMLDKTLNDLTEKQHVTNSDEQKAGVDSKFITYKVQSTTRFSKAPKQLMLKTPKYSHLGEETTQAFDSIPEVLNLQKYMIEGAASEPLYLKGFTCHGGSGIGKVGGHYTAYFTKIEDGKTVYYHANDSHVSKISKSAFLEAAKRASELFYDNTPN